MRLCFSRRSAQCSACSAWGRTTCRLRIGLNDEARSGGNRSSFGGDWSKGEAARRVNSPQV